jgi:hypothetical protein
MPTSEFQTALTERIEFAVFVAYEQWVRASNYVSANPYDVLARLLPALPESLTQAASSRGGWGAFDPVNGLPTDEARILISEMAAQVAKARIAALAADAPEADQLATVIVDAINRSVTAFVEDPESWRLALNPGERAPLAALGEGAAVTSGEGSDAEPHGQLPPAPEMVEAGGDHGAAASRLVQVAESAGRPEFQQRLAATDVWFGKDAGNKVVAEATLDLSSLMVDFDVAPRAGNSSLPEGELLKEFLERVGVVESPSTPELPALPTDKPPDVPDPQQQPIDPRYGLPSDVAAVIDKWFDLLSKAKFYRVQEDGSIYRLNEAEAQAIVDTLIDVLVRRAQLDLALPSLPESATPAHSAAAAPAQPPADAGSTPDTAAAAGLGSDTLQIPSAPPAADSGETELASTVLLPAADPVPDAVPASSPADVMPPVLPPLVQPATDPWTV